MYSDHKMNETTDTQIDKGILPEAYGYAYELPTNDPLNGTVTIFVDMQEPNSDPIRLTKHCNSQSCNIRYMTHSIYSMLTHYANYEPTVIVKLLDSRNNYTMFNGTLLELEPPKVEPVPSEILPP